MEYALELKAVSKSIRGRKIVDEISLAVRPGEILGFLGPNGSGKTTTIRMIVGLVKPDQGEIFISGYSVDRQKDRAMAEMGCIVENPELYPWLTGWENLVQFGSMKGIKDSARLKEAAALVGLSNRIQDPVRTYSLGMRQRLGLAAAMLARPKLLILDEPVNGLDPAGIAELRNLLRSMAREGLAVFLSSHLLAEVQQVCDRVAIISKGRLLYTGEPDTVGRQYIRWQVQDIPRAGQILTQLGLPWTEHHGRITAAVPRENLPEINQKLAMAHVGLELILPGELAVEELFLELTGGDEIA